MIVYCWIALFLLTKTSFIIQLSVYSFTFFTFHSKSLIENGCSIQPVPWWYFCNLADWDFCAGEQFGPCVPSHSLWTSINVSWTDRSSDQTEVVNLKGFLSQILCQQLPFLGSFFCFLTYSEFTQLRCFSCLTHHWLYLWVVVEYNAFANILMFSISVHFAAGMFHLKLDSNLFIPHI